MTKTLEDPRKVFGNTICSIAMEDPRVVILSADSGKSSGFGDFMKCRPDRYFEFGIMEQAVVGIASGMATAGNIPVFCAIAPFVTARPYEMVRNDLGYMKQNVKIVGRNGGITYSDLGSTHHSLDDFAIMRIIPGIVILNPQDPDEIRESCRAMMAYEGPVYMRIGNERIPNVLPHEKFEIGKGRLIEEGTDITVFTTGSLTANVIEACSILRAQGISVELIGLPTLYPLDEEMILHSVERTRMAVTVEEHYVYGGLGTMIGDLLSQKSPVPMKKLGIPNTYATTGPYGQILNKYGLDPVSISKAVGEFCRGDMYGI